MGSHSLLFKCEVSAPVLRGALTVLVALLGLLFGSGVVLAQAELPQILGVRVSTTPERARLIIDLSASAEYGIASLDGPERIAVDLKAAGAASVAPQAVAGNGIVASFTTAMTADGEARAELTLNQPAVVQQAYMLDPVADQPAQLIVDLIGTTELDFKARVAADLASSISLTTPGVSSEEPVPAPNAASTSSSEAPAAASPEPPSSSSPVAAELPTDPGSRPLVVIDPGHGGIDNGASAPSGIHEKDITLAFALQLRDLLVKSGHFDVALTRDDDTYLTLNERVDLARQNKADLFISLHADTFQQADIRGASIYTRDENATDILDKVLADGENRADVVSGYVPKDEKPAVVDILVDLMRRQARQQAYLAAEEIVKAMEPSVALRRFPVRQADFFVLQAPDVPSMLIELGFMSNPADIANLEDNDWRNKVVGAIANGVDAYFKDLRSGATSVAGP